MKKFLTSVICLMSAVLLSAQENSNSQLEAKLSEYCASIIGESLTAQCTETDYIIESCQEADMRQYVAVWLYTHYFTSKVMGHETVAIHIYDKWFSDGKLSFYNDMDYISASIFADVNRNTLLGMKAPSALLEDTDGNAVRIFSESMSRPAVLYFYSTDCSKCKIENIMLRNVIENLDYGIDIYAVCTKGSAEEWENVRSGALNFQVENSVIHHLRNKADDNSWKDAWGVLQTPATFLVESDMKIVGRALDSNALEQLLQMVHRKHNMVYGEAESMDFYDAIFADGTSPEILAGSADHIARRTLEETRDTMLFKQMTGDLLYYLSNSEDGGLRNGLPDFVQKQILDRSDVWTTQEDTLQIISLARMLKEVGERASVGSRIPRVKVYGFKVDGKGEGKVRRRSLRLLPKSYTHIMFYSPMCWDCKIQSEKLAERAGKEKIKVLKVNLDAMEKDHPELFRKLIEEFDLTHVPYITKVHKGRITEKYCTF